MSERRSEYLGALVGPVYFIAILLVVLPLADLAINVWPLRPGQVEWRFGTIGLLSSYLLTPVIGAVLILVAAGWAEHAVARRVAGGLCAVGAIVLVLVTPLFVLDWFQIRAQAPVEARPGIDLGSVRTVLKQLITAGAVGWLGIAGFRRSGTAAARVSRKTTPLIRSAEPSED